MENDDYLAAQKMREITQRIDEFTRLNGMNTGKELYTRCPACGCHWIVTERMINALLHGNDLKGKCKMCENDIILRYETDAEQRIIITVEFPNYKNITGRLILLPRTE